MAWAILVVAGLLEVAWATGLKYTDGFTRPVPSVLAGTVTLKFSVTVRSWAVALTSALLPERLNE